MKILQNILFTFIGTPPPPGQWQISPNSPATGGAPAFGGGKVVPTMSPSRRSGVNIPTSVGNIPALSPIQGSPNKGTGSGDPQGAEGGTDPKALMQWAMNLNLIYKFLDFLA